MSRTLILMRHARQSTVAARDHERPLTDEGRAVAHRVGAALAAEGLVPDHALSSTALRCRQTWECVSAGLDAAVDATFEPSLYNASPRGLLDGLAGVDDAVQTLLLLAHNPGISVLALELAGDDDEARATLQNGFSPASTARFEVDCAWSTVSPRTARFLRFEPR